MADKQIAGNHLTDSQLARISAATHTLAAVASEIEFNGNATVKEAETFGLVSAALMALNRALGVNGQERVSW